MHATSTLVTDRLTLLYLPSLACVFGIFVFWGLQWTIPLYFVLGYIALGFVLLTITRCSGDWLNALSLILLIGFVRFSLSGALLWLGAQPGTSPDIPMLQMLSFDNDEWLLAHSLALMGLLGAVIGWFLPVNLRIFRRVSVHRKTDLSNAIIYAGSAGMLAGFLALVAFVGSNASGVEVIYTGGFRSVEIQEGTGKYFHFSLLLIASSVVVSAYLASVKRPWWFVLLPVMLAAIIFWVLGGRVRSFAALAAGLILLWYRRASLKISLKTVLIGALMAPLLIVFLFAGQVYRGGLGVEGIAEELSITALLEYVQYTVWVDLGHLHSLAGAVAVGPGLLWGQTFSYNLLWPLSQLLDWPGRSGGVVVVERLLGFAGGKWGFHTTLIGDAYLNFGISGVFVVTVMFGMILRIVYEEFRQGKIDTPYYSLTLIYSIRVFFESIEKFGEGLIVLMFAFCVIKLSHILLKVALVEGRGNPRFPAGEPAELTFYALPGLARGHRKDSGGVHR